MTRHGNTSSTSSRRHQLKPKRCEPHPSPTEMLGGHVLSKIARRKAGPHGAGPLLLPAPVLQQSQRTCHQRPEASEFQAHLRCLAGDPQCPNGLHVWVTEILETSLKPARRMNSDPLVRQPNFQSVTHVAWATSKTTMARIEAYNAKTKFTTAHLFSST